MAKSRSELRNVIMVIYIKLIFMRVDVSRLILMMLLKKI